MKKKIYFIYLIFLFVLPNSTQAQLEWNNWLMDSYESIQEISFFSNNYYQFKTNNVQKNKYFQDNQINHINLGLISTISDKINGKLELYTNGSLIFNSKNKLLENGEIINKIIDDNLIDTNFNGKRKKEIIFEKNIIFRSKVKENNINILTFTILNKPGLYNTLIDINGNNGDGKVIFKDSLIEDSCIGVSGGFHKNGKDIWIITYNYRTNKIVSILFNANGNVIDKVYFNNYKQFTDINPLDKRSYTYIQIRVNSLSNKIAITYLGKIFLYNFNNESGELTFSNNYNMSSNQFGLEFSLNGKYLYILDMLQNKDAVEIKQFNIFNKNELQIPKTKQIKSFTNRQINNSNALRISIDGKLYFSDQIFNKIYQLNDPNNDLDLQQINEIQNVYSYGSFQHTFPTEPPKFELNLKSNAPFCANSDTLKLYSNFSHSEIPDVVYEWTAPNGVKFTTDSVYILKPNITFSGKYYLRVTSNFLSADILDSIDVKLYHTPEFEVVKDGEECGSSSVKISCDRDFPNTFTYLWNTGATTKDISATTNGVYTLTVTDTNGCKTSKSITVTFGQKPTASISATGPTTFCEGGKVELRASGGLNSNDLFFRWSTGETVPNITVTESGIYRVVITHKFSQCVDSADVEINVNANLECKIVQNNGLCKGSKTTLIAEPQGIEYKYLWSTGETTSSIIVSQGGQYSVEVSLDEFCKSSANIDVIENEVEEFEILAVGSFCVGDSVMLSASKEFASYEWSTGEITKDIIVKNSGIYSVIAIDMNGCRSEKSITMEFKSPREYNLDFIDYDFGDVEIGAEKRVKVNIPGEVGISIRGDFAYDMITNEMVFSPDAEKNYSGEIVLNYGGECDTSATILFVGRGVNSVRFKAEVIAPSIETEAGLDNVELPFIFNINRDDLVYPFEMTYKMSFEINLDVFVPNFATTIVNDKRVVELNGTTLINKGENILTTILGDTYLSEFVDNPINIVDFEHNLPKTDIDKIDGNIRIVGICTQNLRAIKFRIMTKLNITPNPTLDKLFAKVSTAEKGNHRLFLTSITGTKIEIKSFVVGDDLLEDTVFEQTYDINISEMPEGTYILELQTPNQSITEKVLIVR